MDNDDDSDGEISLAPKDDDEDADGCVEPSAEAEVDT